MSDLKPKTEILFAGMFASNAFIAYVAESIAVAFMFQSPPLLWAMLLKSPFGSAYLVDRPIKCFERAVERCHTDSLSSIVASCSWGKHVAVGTGTPLQIMWSKKEVASNLDVVTDVYDFLHLEMRGFQMLNPKM
ncbi:DNA-directed RNA polymerase V subunit 1-like isoform X2 [Magnolia sinica]|uniref:DNA-directed RNA polymerase V subunit 1-like isoform X2 n=1 Tax=Magnolia sinica TaxID=86752 RepID=UPI00265A019A|nr:DNA-directed RNA polymerase V subunit 1-like isoform X2 [Magnolia sinica]